MYRNTQKHVNADCLSRLPTPDCSEGLQSYDAAELFHINQVHMISVDSDELRRETNINPTLIKVLLLSFKSCSRCLLYDNK